MTRGLTRRGVVSGGLIGGAVMALPAGLMASESESREATAAIDTVSGKIRGIRTGGVSKFLGIPYGDDTAKARFQPAQRPAPWTGVRDCTAYGYQAPQSPMSLGGGGEVSPTAPAMSAIASLFASSFGAVENEDCLFLDIYTPDASHARKRPVMVWLHGGGFAVGSGGNAGYDGTGLCNRGDVLVVTLNHRLGALGYLYLGGLHSDFADSGNVGQLDQVLALQWVHDNIAAFGGDPGNVTIFGESGGGAKVGTLLGMPPAQGLFHKAIQQSGAVIGSVEKDDAMERAERTLAKLDIAKDDVHQLQSMDYKAVVKAAGEAQLPPPPPTGMPDTSRSDLTPVADGRSLPAHPFSPDATEISRDIPLMIGTTRDEMTLFTALDPRFGNFTEEQARARFDAELGTRGPEAFEHYKSRRPDDAPTYWITSMLTDLRMWANSVLQAERKSAQDAAPVFMYRLDWESPVVDGTLRAPHGLDIGLVFDNVKNAAGLVGTGPEAQILANDMAQAWVNFAKSGDPSMNGVAWPAYDEETRKTMIFDMPSHVAEDPDGDTREFWRA